MTVSSIPEQTADNDQGETTEVTTHSHALVYIDGILDYLECQK